VKNLKGRPLCQIMEWGYDTFHEHTLTNRTVYRNCAFYIPRRLDLTKKEGGAKLGRKSSSGELSLRKVYYEFLFITIRKRTKGLGNGVSQASASGGFGEERPSNDKKHSHLFLKRRSFAGGARCASLVNRKLIRMSELRNRPKKVNFQRRK